MTVRDIIADSVRSTGGLGWSCKLRADDVLDALRRAAGGADRVVLAWEPTPCPYCRHGRIVGAVTGERDCPTCGGSGVVGYTVTLHTLEAARHRGDCDVCFMGIRCTCGAAGSFRLVAVSPEPPKEPKP